MDAFLARQPILDRDMNLCGYELLFRDGAENYFRSADSEKATSSLISDAVHLHSIEKLTGGRTCFINFTRTALLDELYSMLPPSTTVVEVLESVELDDELIRACHRVRSLGYTLALDDYILDPRFEPLLPLIDILKVEFPVLTQSQHLAVVESARRHGFRLLAEKVETPDQCDLARKLGYHYFQGYFFCVPQMLKVRRLPESHAQCLRLLQLTSGEDFNIDLIEEQIRGDVSLSYKLLRYVNSPQLRRAVPVKSIRQAITTLGQRPLQKWVSLIAINAMYGQKPSELVSTSLVRGHFCELAGAKVLDSDLASEGFLTGMFSLLDALLDQPMEELTRELGLTSAAQAALLSRESPLLPVLQLAIAVETGDWQAIGILTSTMGIEQSQAFAWYAESIQWSAAMWPVSDEDS